MYHNITVSVCVIKLKKRFYRPQIFYIILKKKRGKNKYGQCGPNGDVSVCLSALDEPCRLTFISY